MTKSLGKRAFSDSLLAFTGKGVNHLSPQNTVKLPRMVCLVTHLGPAEPASVFIPVSVGEDKEQGFPDRRGAAASRAVKLHSFQFFKIGLLFPWPMLHGRNGLKRAVFHEYSLWQKRRSRRREKFPGRVQPMIIMDKPKGKSFSQSYFAFDKIPFPV